MATHSSILAWEIPWTEDPGGLQSSWGCKESDTMERALTGFLYKKGLWYHPAPPLTTWLC